MAARAPIPIETERISPCLSFRFLLPSTARFFDATVFGFGAADRATHVNESELFPTAVQRAPDAAEH